MLAPPKYSDIVDHYNLDVLKHGADIQLTSDGDLLMTRDGDLQLGDDRFNAFFRLVRGWQLNAPTIELLLNSVITMPERAEQLIAEQNDVAVRIARGELAADVLHALSDEAGAVDLGRDAYAGAIMVILTNLLRRFRDDLGIRGNAWRQTGPVFQGWSLAAIVETGANSFRHHDEWATQWVQNRCYTPQQMNSIRVISDVTNTTDLRLLGRNMAPELLSLLSDNSFDKLANRFFESAKGLV